MIKHMRIEEALRRLKKGESLSGTILSVNSASSLSDTHEKIKDLNYLDSKGFVFTPALLNYSRCFTVAFKPSTHKKGERVMIPSLSESAYMCKFSRTITGNCAFSYVNNPDSPYLPLEGSMSNRAIITDAGIDESVSHRWYKVDGFLLPIYMNKERVAMAQYSSDDHNRDFIKCLKSLKGYLGDFKDET